MIRINLLPFRAARKSENIRRQVSLFFLSVILVFVAIIAIQIWQNRTKNQMEEKLENSKKELEIVKKDAQKVEEMKNKLAVLQKKNEAILLLDKNRKDQVVLLDSMTELIIPNRMWFTNFDATGNKVVITGVSLDNKTTADFMTRLENSPLFSNVILQSIVQTGDKLKNFSITCVKASSAPSK